MISGIGVDILNISRLDRSLGFNDPFVLKTFTAAEIDEAKKSRDSARFFASRFACKEAIFKCLKMDGNVVRLNEIEIRSSDLGYPIATLLGNLKTQADERGIVSIEVSLSHEENYIIAYAIAQNNN